MRTQANQWCNTSDVISWFKTLENKDKLTFFKFDIVSFYPSISKTLFENTLDWAKQYYSFTDQSLEIIRNSRKSFLFHHNNTWVKKHNEDFDVTMGSFDGAEVCDLVGLYILSKLTLLIDNYHVGLYRDDGLAAIPGSGPKVDRLRKDIFNIFKNIGLKVTIECNSKQTDFLDVYLDLKSETFRAFRKDSQLPIYINVNSNHPRSIKKSLPQIVSKRISKLSSSKQLYERDIEPYQAALKQAGYKDEIKYCSNEASTHKKNQRKRKIIWFNPPYSETVKTNVASKFLSLVDKHFKNSPLNKYFNRNNIKVSYSCMPNLESIICSNNKRVLSNVNKSASVKLKCNCRGGTTVCPLAGRCLEKELIYKAEVECENSDTTSYIGQTSNTFKERFTQHNQTFRNEKYEGSTALSKHIWNLKRKNKTYNINWSILSKASTYNPSTKQCNLCTTEKTLILLSKDIDLLNKRSELMGKCRHRAKYLLSGIT